MEMTVAEAIIFDLRSKLKATQSHREELVEQLHATERQRNELAALLVEMSDRYDRLEQLYFDATGQTLDCPNGTIDRARKALASL